MQTINKKLIELFDYRSRLNAANMYADELLTLLKVINTTFAPAEITPDEIAVLLKKLDDLDTYIKAMSFARLKIKGGSK